MPVGHRKKPFSNKQKKEQIKAKREQKRNQERDEYGNALRDQKGKHKKASEHSAEAEENSENENQNAIEAKLMNPQPALKQKENTYDPNRYRLQFMKDTKEEIEHRKRLARMPLQILGERDLEMDVGDIYEPGSALDVPRRPLWSYKMSKSQVERQEEKYFRNYLENILETYSTDRLSYLELNLETWRQLWRVIEMADVLLLITDIRHPALHFSPAFYSYVWKELKKPVVLVLNKIDLVSPSLVVAWKQYFQRKYPDIYIVLFTSFPKDKEEIAQANNKGVVQKKRRKKSHYSAVGPKQLLHVCEKIVQDRVDLSIWREKIDNEIAGVEPVVETEVRMEEETNEMTSEREQFKHGVLTIGCCGYPNVGKSSLINGLMGRKVVSVSKTPGHTKHFQTIYLTPQVKVCDCPGLVFPSLVPKPMQILAGIYPVAQVREPYTAVGYLAQRIPLPSLLKLSPPVDVMTGVAQLSKPLSNNIDCNTDDANDNQSDYKWSAMDICDAWAEKRRFLTAKAARNDVYRAANNILRLALEGRLIMCTRPPGYTDCKENWEGHPETEEIAQLQKFHREITEHKSSSSLCDSSSDEENYAFSQEECEADSEDEKLSTDEAATSNPFALLNEDC